GMQNVVLDNYFEKTKKETEVKIKALAELIIKEHPFLEVKAEVSDQMDAAMTILNKAKEIKADLIVMGSHGRKGMNRILMGSVAESILRQAPCAVLIYKSKQSSKK
ncbi:MAG: universal stress protein, partial [Saprospiraceae bacterium]